MKYAVCFVGSTHYSLPLDETTLKKFRTLGALGRICVVGFSRDTRPLHFSAVAEFFLLPRPTSPVLRYLLMFAIGPALTTWTVFRRRVEILVAQSPYEGVAAALAKIVARFFGRRVALIVESHGDFQEAVFLHRRVRLPRFYRLVMRTAARFSCGRADALRAVSGFTRRQLESWAPGRPVVQFPAWTDIDLFLSAEASDQPWTREKTVLFAGALTALKGVDLLLEAFSRVALQDQEVRLHIVGSEEDQQFATRLRVRVAELGLQQRVQLSPPVSQSQLADLIRRCAVFVLPSRSEGLGRVILEAMACGTLVVATRAGGPSEVIEDGETGLLINVGDVEALYERIGWVLSHPEHAREIGQKARRSVRQMLSPAKYLANYATLFEMVLARAPLART